MLWWHNNLYIYILKHFYFGNKLKKKKASAAMIRRGFEAGWGFALTKTLKRGVKYLKSLF